MTISIQQHTTRSDTAGQSDTVRNDTAIRNDAVTHNAVTHNAVTHNDANHSAANRNAVISHDGTGNRTIVGAGPAGQGSALGRDLARALQLITEAELAPSPAERYLAAHLAAQQVAAVVLASGPTRLAAGPSDPWPAVARVAPECGEWAAWFAAMQGKRRAVAAGVRAIVSEREADDLVRDARGFHDMAAARLERIRRGVGVRNRATPHAHAAHGALTGGHHA